MDGGKRERSLNSKTAASTSTRDARTESDDDVVLLEGEEESDSDSSNDRFSLSSGGGRKPYTPTMRARKWGAEEERQDKRKK